MVALSVLDLAPIVAGGTPGQALENSRDLAQHAERLGYKRYWLAEHHNMPGIASAATAVAIAHVAGGTSTIRVGAGGIMLPNHAPLVIAEQFGTLASLYPGRIDLALGRAPGTDQLTAHALRRSLNATNMDDYPRDVMELMYYFRDAEPAQKVRAIPGAGTKVPVWILGSSTYGAQLAAALGLPYGFASHFAPAELDQAIEIYRANYRPSEENPKPYVMVGTSVFAAPTDEEARYLFSSQQQAFVNLRTGNPGPLPPPVEDFEENLDPRARFILGQALSCAIVGSPETVKRGLKDFAARTGADEIIATANMFDHAARVRSYEIAAAARQELEKAA
jgi:luciferase family oxidoreductase group 1